MGERVRKANPQQLRQALGKVKTRHRNRGLTPTIASLALSITAAVAKLHARDEQHTLTGWQPADDWSHTSLDKDLRVMPQIPVYQAETLIGGKAS